MPRRRPPRDVRVVNNFILLTAAFTVLLCLVSAQQQQRPGGLDLRQRQESPHENLKPESAVHTIEATKLPQHLETPLIAQRRKNTLSIDNNNNNDASAIATLAPANSAVAAPSSRQPSTSAGLASPLNARNLKDWEVEDFVLLATVDGTLHARDRKNGKPRWKLELDNQQPMVQTTYYRPNRSTVEEDFETIPIDNYLWAIEPSRDGSLYIYRPSGPSPGLVNTGLTMRKLVEEMSPYANEDPPVIYTGEKKTTMMTVNTETGMVMGYFSPTVAQPEGNCDNRAFQEPARTLAIGRTEYTVGIQSRKDGRTIAILRYFEWTPNNFDNDLERQYLETKDKTYVYPKHDGQIRGLYNPSGSEEDIVSVFRQRGFPTPVVRVFDVGRHYTLENPNPELSVLSQPPPPEEDGTSAERRASSIFLNHTEDGSWYAMSGRSYPLIDMQKPQEAQCMRQDWKSLGHPWDITNDARLSEALVGLHSIAKQSRPEAPVLTLPAPVLPNDSQLNDFIPDNSPAEFGGAKMIHRLQQLPRLAAKIVLDFFTNPLWIIMAIMFLFSYKGQIRTAAGRLLEEKRTPSFLKPVLEHNNSVVTPVVRQQEEPVAEISVPEQPVDDSRVPTGEDGTTVVEITVDKEMIDVSDVPDVPPKSSSDVPVGSPEKKKEKKAHRGRRGGVKHKKGKDKTSSPENSVILDVSQDGNPPKPQPTVDDAVRNAQKMGQQTNLEPDIQTVPNDPSAVSGPILRVGALECDTEQLIGTGSNGTMVFKGKFDGRDVAVKRMLIQFFDIASQETKLLRESDDHPNVIRYYAQQQAAGFLYIALELCPASLADVIEKPSLHRSLAQGGERDLPGVLYQIANGLQHLHNLRIVHRDLKPQNILVAMGKDGNPRLLVSDFGLCKKLEGEQSSFRATTAHAAGTSGWRAPELLLDDDAKEGLSMVDASTDGNSGPLLSPDLMPNRRATRAIDIFSLGLVFFFVLTKGSHPFDCGDRYMREVNIRKGKHDLSRLSMYGDYGEEARSLIESMLETEPKKRPSAREVMAHPFFWSPKKRLNFLCDISDHFEKEKRDPPTRALEELEKFAPHITHGDFLKTLTKEFVDSLGKQRKYTGSRLLDLLRALRNKKNHYEDMSDKLKKEVGPLPDGYLSYWTIRFPKLLLCTWDLVYYLEWDDTDRFREYYQPERL